MKNYRKAKVGDTIRFKRADGTVQTDVVRGHFIADVLLEPYARNEKHPALILTNHSWCRESHVVEVIEG